MDIRPGCQPGQWSLIKGSSISRSSVYGYRASCHSWVAILNVPAGHKVGNIRHHKISPCPGGAIQVNALIYKT